MMLVLTALVVSRAFTAESTGAASHQAAMKFLPQADEAFIAYVILFAFALDYVLAHGPSVLPYAVVGGALALATLRTLAELTQNLLVNSHRDDPRRACELWPEITTFFELHPYRSLDFCSLL